MGVMIYRTQGFKHNQTRIDANLPHPKPSLVLWHAPCAKTRGWPAPPSPVQSHSQTPSGICPPPYGNYNCGCGTTLNPCTCQLAYALSEGIPALTCVPSLFEKPDVEKLNQWLSRFVVEARRHGRMESHILLVCYIYYCLVYSGMGAPSPKISWTRRTHISRSCLVSVDLSLNSCVRMGSVLL